MTVYASAIATAQRMIAAKGASCVWRVPTTPDVADPTKPWIETDAAPPTEHAVKIVFLPITRINSQLMRFLVGQGYQPGGNVMGLMASVPFEPTLAGRVVKQDGTVCAVRSVDPIAPDGTPILWTIEFQV